MHDIVRASDRSSVKIPDASRVIGDIRDNETTLFHAGRDFLPVADYPEHAQFRIVVVGNAINKIAKDGDTLHCVQADAIGAEPQDGDLVVIDHAGDEDCCVAIRRLRRIGDLCEFRHESNDPAFQDAPLIQDSRQNDGKIRILGKVLFACRRLGA